MGVIDALKALLGISTYEKPPSTLPSLGDARIDELRSAFGGNLYPPPQTKLRWYIADLEGAQAAADQGDLSSAALLSAAMMGDGVLSGLMSTRTDGLVRLPKRFFGDSAMCAELEGRFGARSVFDDLCPPSELSLMVRDGLQLGVAVGELVPVKGRDFPVLVRLEPQHLRFVWADNRWYYNSIVGWLPITPGDGRWVLHTPMGRVAPWRNSLWRALGQAWIDKTHARLHQANWEAKLAHPARVARPPQGANETMRQSFFQRLMAWGINTVFELPPGYEVQLLESNGRGWESFGKTIDRSEREFMIALAGQTVTTDGGTGFANADIHKSIRSDLIDATGEALSYTLSTQVIPSWTLKRHGVEALQDSPIVAWDTKPPQDLKLSAEADAALGDAIGKANLALQPYGIRVDAKELAARQGLPIQNADGTPIEKALPPHHVPENQVEARRARIWPKLQVAA